jgi:hypothetical protein
MGFETQLTETTKLSRTVIKKSVHMVAGAHVRMKKLIETWVKRTSLNLAIKDL